MANIVFAIAARSFSIDRHTGALSIFEVADGFSFSGKSEPDEETIIPISMTLITLWERSNRDTPEKLRCRARVARPDGTYGEIKSGVNIDLTEHRQGRAIFKIGGFRWGGFGVYRLEVYEQSDDTDTEVLPVARFPFELMRGPELTEDEEE